MRVGGEQPDWIDVREVLESSINIVRHQVIGCARLVVNLPATCKVPANRSRLGQDIHRIFDLFTRPVGVGAGLGRSVRRLIGDRQDVVLVNDGASALSELRKASYDVVLCDVAMPGMDGVSVLEARAEQLPAAPRFVFMTGSMFSQERRQRMNATGAPCVAKPLDIRELSLAVAQVLDPSDPGSERDA